MGGRRVAGVGRKLAPFYLCARHERTLQSGSPEVQAVAPST